jgi:xanthosine utilization system XapX-like protein
VRPPPKPWQHYDIQYVSAAVAIATAGIRLVQWPHDAKDASRGRVGRLSHLQFFFCLALLAADFILYKHKLAFRFLAFVSGGWFVAFLVCLIVWIVLTNQSEYDWFSGPTTQKTQLAVAWVVCLTLSMVSCNSFLIYSFLVPDDKADYKSKLALGLCALIWFVAFLICLIVWIVLMNQPSPSPPTILVGCIVGGLILVSAWFFLCRRRDQCLPHTTGITSTSGSTQQQQQWQQQQQMQQQMAMQQQMQQQMQQMQQQQQQQMQQMQQQQQLALSGTKLYHQTDFATANIIIQTQKMKPGSGGLAGGGIYFATTPELTGHKAHKKGVILEATVALGRIHTLEAAGDPTMTLQKLNSLGYNSVCIARAVSSGQEYVVYDPKQVSAIKVAPSHAPVQAVWSV